MSNYYLHFIYHVIYEGIKYPYHIVDNIHIMYSLNPYEHETFTLFIYICTFEGTKVFIQYYYSIIYTVLFIQYYYMFQNLRTKLPPIYHEYKVISEDLIRSITQPRSFDFRPLKFSEDFCSCMWAITLRKNPKNHGRPPRMALQNERAAR